MSAGDKIPNTDIKPGGCSCSPVQKNGCDCGITSSVPFITPVSSILSGKDTRDHLLARLGQNRSGHRVNPGLYSIGLPGASSPVIVTANYTLSFDAVRSALDGHDAYILVLDTKGINVWCAAGKGTFGTAELINRLKISGLSSVVHHRRLILPQLGAPGVSAHDVHKATGFHVEYGPVRAIELPTFLKNQEATREMRTVTFDIRERIVLIPVELRSVLLPTIIATMALWLMGGWLPASALLASVLAGTVLFPVLLPVIPTVDFSIKGLILGIIVAFPFAFYAFLTTNARTPVWVSVTSALAILLTMSAITAFLALNFTGATPFTSRTGVRKEIFSYIPVMTGAGLIGFSFALITGLTYFMGVWSYGVI
jgi:hypothetical protein